MLLAPPPPPPAHAAMPPANSLIKVTATVEYDDIAGHRQTRKSNEVTATVLLVRGVEISRHKPVEIAPGYPTADFWHVVTNKGNAADTFDLAAVNASGDDGDFSMIVIYHDANGDRLLGDGETTVTKSTGELAPGGEYDMIVQVTMPAGLDAGVSLRADVTATGFSGGGPPAPPSDTVEDVVKIVANDAADMIAIEKKAGAKQVEQGDLVFYEVVVKLREDGPTAGRGRLQDTLPPGFLYVKGSAFVRCWGENGAGCAHMDAFGRTDRDPSGGVGPDLDFPLPDFEHGETVSVSYAARVGSTAGLGRQVNRALTFAYVELGRKRLLSPIDQAEVVVEASRALREEGAVVGKVFLDCDADGVQTPGGGLGETGVPGVRIIFENGVSATTDEFGRYSVYGFDPVTHVARIDPTTLPAGARPRLTDNRQALDARSRFVDLRKGELHRADFALDPCTDAVRGEVAARAEALGANWSLATLLDRKFALAPRDPAAARSRASSGVVAASGGVVADPPSSAPLAGWPKAGPESPAAAGRKALKTLPATRDLAAEIQSFDNALDFVDLADGDVLGQRVVSIRVKGESSGRLALDVNGKEIGEDRVGLKVSWAVGKTAAYEYVAVPLNGGENRLALRQLDPSGNERSRKEIVVFAPGKTARLEVVAPAEAVADGRTPVPISVRLIDRHGIPTPDSAVVTLKATGGRFAVRDMQEGAPGAQVPIGAEGATFDLIPPEVAGSRTVTVESSFHAVEKTIVFLPDLRPMIAVGVVEGAFGAGAGGGG